MLFLITSALSLMIESSCLVKEELTKVEGFGPPKYFFPLPLRKGAFSLIFGC